MGKTRKTLVRVITVLVQLYQFMVSPWLGARCRYQPSCSEYMSEAVLHYGPFKGFLMGLQRVSKCHPWGGQGHDPLPQEIRRCSDDPATNREGTPGVQH